MRHFNYLSALFVVVAAFLLYGCQKSQDVDVRPSVMLYTDDPVENGRISFDLYCASCHGASAVGDGPVSTVLTTPPPDLTMLTVKNNGAFPAEQVYAFVDGRRDIEAHGSREMPVWGAIWSERDGLPVSEEVVQIRISEIVEYLRSIQTQ